MAARQGQRSRFGRHGRWKPPKALGNNIKYVPPGQTAPFTLVFFHNGQTTTLVRRMPASAQHFKTYSIYHDEAVFWTVDYDACTQQVEDGREDSSDQDGSDGKSCDEGTDDERDTWAPLKFASAENEDHPGLSFAGRRQEHRRLLRQRPDQVWAEQLLPDQYQARSENRTNNRRYGGLVGDLPLLIGLMAMALHPSQVATHLPNMIVNPPNAPGSWRVYPPTQVPRRAGWYDKRGLVVSVYYHPEGEEETTADDLSGYENGEQGPILA